MLKILQDSQWRAVLNGLVALLGAFVMSLGWWSGEANMTPLSMGLVMTGGALIGLVLISVAVTLAEIYQQSQIQYEGSVVMYVGMKRHYELGFCTKKRNLLEYLEDAMRIWLKDTVDLQASNKTQRQVIATYSVDGQERQYSAYTSDGELTRFCVSTEVWPDNWK
jgi:hypothetical protein